MHSSRHSLRVICEELPHRHRDKQRGSVFTADIQLNEFSKQNHSRVNCQRLRWSWGAATPRLGKQPRTLISLIHSFLIQVTLCFPTPPYLLNTIWNFDACLEPSCAQQVLTPVQHLRLSHWTWSQRQQAAGWRRTQPPGWAAERGAAAAAKGLQVASPPAAAQWELRGVCLCVCLEGDASRLRRLWRVGVSAARGGERTWLHLCDVTATYTSAPASGAYPAPVWSLESGRKKKVTCEELIYCPREARWLISCWVKFRTL